MSEKQPNTPMDENPIASFNLKTPDFQVAENLKDRSGLQAAEDLKASPELHAELNNPKEIIDSVSGQKFEVLELNRNAEGPPLVMTLAWSINAQTPGVNYEAEQTALQTGRRMLIINNPNTANSDKLNDHQLSELKTGSGFDAVTKPLLRALRAQGIDHMDLEGTSMGGRMAASLAANASEVGINIDSLVLIDPPGVTERSLIKLINDFVGEAPNQARYHELTRDPHYSGSDSLLDTVKFFVALVRQGFDANFLSYTRAMAKGNIATDVMAALATQSDLKVTWIYGNASRISNPQEVMTTYQELPQDLKDRVRLQVLPGETHALGEGQAKRTAAHVKDALKGWGKQK